jgi:hypothetical protein
VPLGCRGIKKELKMSEYYWDNKIEEAKIDRKYDIAMCHAFLLHMSDSKKVL